MKYIPENIALYARLKGISERAALQVFLQILVLKNIRWSKQKMIGGTVLVLGHGNPRFSEDIDLTALNDPMSLETDLQKAGHEVGVWLKAKAKLTAPKPGKSTWKLKVCFDDEPGQISLHIDSQTYPSHSSHSVVVAFQGIPPFIIPSVSLVEIMADKLIALAMRHYVGGRDIFDLWYHWFNTPDSAKSDKPVLDILKKKAKDRKIKEDIITLAGTRLAKTIPSRCVDEWDRYLPQNLRHEGLYQTIYKTVQSKLEKLKK
ncbi:MAG: nucleotidyl transferase AbiEii/AbiGii toxin family protein [Deltaproteobacteria bacterium]|nr:nucleotidyl transferase AbiEii/AbiGii toxin family protein [Deltaproteobacteria bacterium]